MKMRPHRYLVSEIGSEPGQEGCLPFHILIRTRKYTNVERHTVPAVRTGTYLNNNYVL
jgi:hypothetical protein